MFQMSDAESISAMEIRTREDFWSDIAGEQHF